MPRRSTSLKEKQAAVKIKSKKWCLYKEWRMMKTNHNVSSASQKKSRVSPIQDQGMASVLLSEEAQDTSSSQHRTVNPVKMRNPSNLPTPAGFSKHRRPLCLDRVMTPIDTGHCSSVNCSLGHRVEMSPVVLVQKLPESESTSGNVLSNAGSSDETEQAVESLMVEHQVSPASIPAHGQQPTACPSPNTLIQTTHKTTRQRSKTTRRSSNTPALSANRGTDQPTKRKRSNPGKDSSCSQDCVRRRTKNSKPELRCPLLPVATATVNNSEQPVKKKRGRPPKVQLQASQCDTSHKSPHYMVTQMDMRQGGVKVLVKEVPVSKRKTTSCYKCKTCGFRTKDKAAKMEHIQACHSHRCPYCQRGFSSQEVLSSHKTVCAVESSLQCSVCQRSFHRTHRKQHFHGHIHSLIVQGVRNAVREIQQCGSLDKFLSSITCDPASECQKCHPAWLTLEQDHGKQPVEELPQYAECFPDYSDIPVTHTSHHFVPVAVGSDGAGTEDTSAVGNHHLSSCSYYDQGTGFSYEQSIPSDTHCTTDTELQGTIVYDFDNDMYIFNYKDDACTARDVQDSAGVSDSQTAGSVSDQSLSCKPASHEDHLHQARGGSEMTGAQGSDSYEGSIIHASQTEAPGSKIMLADFPSQPCQTLDFPDHQGGETSNGGSTFTDLLELLDEFDLNSMDVGEETLVGLDALCEDSGAGDKLVKTLPLPSVQNTQMDYVVNNPSSVCCNPEAGFVSGAGTPDKHVHNDQLMSSWGPPEDCVGRQQGCCSGSGPATQAGRAAQHGQTSQRHPAPCTQSEHVVRDSSLSVGNCSAFLGATEVEVMPGGHALSNMGGNTGRGLSVDPLLPSLDYETGQPLYSSLTHLDDSSYTNGSDDSGIEVHACVSAVSGSSDCTSSATVQELVCIGESRMGSCCTDTRLTELNSSRQAESGQTEVETPNSDSNTVPCNDKAPNPSGTSTSQNVSLVNTSTVHALSPCSEHVSTYAPQGGDRKTSTSQNVSLVNTSTVFALSPCSEHVSTYAPQGGDRKTSTSQNVSLVNTSTVFALSPCSEHVSTYAPQGGDRKTSTSQNVRLVNTSTVFALSPCSEHVSTYAPQGGDRQTSTSQNVSLVNTSTVFALSPCSEHVSTYAPQGGDRKTSTSQNVSLVNTSTVFALSPCSEHVSTFAPQGGDRKTSTSQNVSLVNTSTVFALSPCSEHVSTFAPQGGDRKTSTSQNVGPVNRLADCTISHSSKQVSADASQGSDRGLGHPLGFEVGSVATIKNAITTQVEKTKPGQQLNRDLAGTSSSPHLDVLCISSEDMESLPEPELSEEDIDRSSLTHYRGVGLKAHPSNQALFNVTSSCQSAASDSQMGTDRNTLNSDTPGFSCPNTNLVRLTSDHSEFTGTVTADCATVMILHANSLPAVWASGQCLLPSETEGTADASHLESCAQDKGAEEPLDSSNTGEGRLPSSESLQTFSAFVSTEKCISGTLQFLKETVLSTGTNTACRKIEVSEQAAHITPETYQGMLKMPETEKIIAHRSVDVEAADSVVCPSAESVSDSKSKPAALSSYPRLTGHTVGRLVGICPESCSSVPDKQVSTPVARPDVMTSSTTDCGQPFSPAITSSPKVKQLTLTTQASTAAVIPLNAQVQQNLSADSPESAGLEHTIEQPSSLVVQNSAMSPQSLDKFGFNTRVVETSIEPERKPTVASVSNTCSISAPTFSPHVSGSAPETPVLHEIEMNSSGGRKDDSTDFEVKLAVCNMNSGKRTVSDFQGNVQMVLTAPAVHTCCVSAVSGNDSAVVKPNLDDLDVSTLVTEEKSLPLLQIFADIPSSEQTPRVTADTEVTSATNPVVDGVSVKLLTTEHAYAAALDMEWSSVKAVTY